MAELEQSQMDAHGLVQDWYTPKEHPLALHLMNRQSSSHIARVRGWPLDSVPKGSKHFHEYDHFTRRFPVEARYFQSPLAVAACLSHTFQLPPPSFDHTLATNVSSGLNEREGGQCEPKFSCGPARTIHRHHSDCTIVSIGSAGETCFEEYMHRQVPRCGIHVFDPTLTSDGRAHLKALEQQGVLRFHQSGLADQRTVNGYSTFKDYRFKSSLDRWRMRFCDTERALDPVNRKAMGCMTARMLTLSEMYKEMRVDWIDYLKIDWYAEIQPFHKLRVQWQPALTNLQHHAFVCGR